MDIKKINEEDRDAANNGPKTVKVDVPRKLTIRQELEFDPILKGLIDHIPLETIIDDVTQTKLRQLRATVDFDLALDEQVEVLRLCIDLLNYLGYKDKANMHQESLILNSPADILAAEINARITRGKMPLKQYCSNVGIYGYATKIEQGEIVYEKRSTDTIIDKLENVAFKNDDLGGSMVTNGFRKALRRKATVEEVADNIQAFGLESNFRFEKGKFYQKLADFDQHAMLDDLLRLQARDHHFLKNLDPLKALKVAAEMIAAVHSKSQRGIGIITNNIVLEVENGEIKKARLTLPDMIYEKQVNKYEQQAMDLLDLCFSAGIAGIQSGGAQKHLPLQLAQRNIQTILNSYDDGQTEAYMVKMTLKALMKNRPPHLTWHNKTRYGFDRIQKPKKHFEVIKSVILEVLERASQA